MSAGTKPYTFRLDPQLVAEMEEAIKSRNLHSKHEPWTWSAFVRDAIRAKLDHRKRGKQAARRKVFGPTVETYTTVDYTPEGGIQ